jgi:UDP-GlcNAc:undecaprenyl-phosphate/decaprenyl-phosphate GlcNAc-1-phosphate transferase
VGVGVSTLASCCAASAALSAGICCYAKTLARAVGLFDKPDGVRKLHTSATPLVGGLALFVPSMALSLLFLVQGAENSFVVVAITAAAIMLSVGVIDDRSGLSPVWRLLVMMFFIFTAFSVEPLFELHTLKMGLFGRQALVSLEPFAAPITALIILGFANATNMADGMNGQLLGSVIIWSSFIAVHLGLPQALPFMAVICSALVTVVFNLRGKLFSGSSGAYAAAIFIGLGAIAAYRRSHGAMSAEMPLFWFWLPVLDCMRLMIGRAIRHTSPLEGDRNHFHHILLEKSGPHRALAIYLAMLAAPGMVAEANLTAGGATLIGCIAVYAVIGATKASARDRYQPKAIQLTKTLPGYTARVGRRVAGAGNNSPQEINPAAGA